jgi:(1->4)-alpha-D-glucan 1-alpha-D-glucosylmutase
MIHAHPTAASLAAGIAQAVQQMVESRRRPRTSTYRLQFNAQFTFRDAAAIVPYLHRLGISHVYASPYLRAKAGSMHGYDVCDHHVLNPELGTAEDYANFVAELKSHGMAHILDVVPNHMAASCENPWWQDVLENGPISPYAHYFDIDWHPVQDELNGKVLLPILGQQYGDVLESGQLQLEHADGGFFLRYFDNVLPVGPKTAIPILLHRIDELRAALGEESDAVVEYQSIVTSLEHLPGRIAASAEQVAERQREKEVVKRRLRRLETDEPLVAEFVARNLQEFNGRAGEPNSFDRLDALLDEQAYRLSHWKAASDEVNYRRFFDINGLAALCMEVKDVFDDTHRLVLDLLARGDIDGLRIDHIDGLFDPLQYLWRLQWAYLESLGSRLYEEGKPDEAAIAPVAAMAGIGSGDSASPTTPTFSTADVSEMHNGQSTYPPREAVRPALMETLCRQLQMPLPEQPTGEMLPEETPLAPRLEFDRSAAPDHGRLPLYVVVEKILGPDEPLPENWPVDGTSGYDFLAQLNGLFLEPQGVKDIQEAYFRFTGEKLEFSEVVYRCKMLILRVAMSSELQMLAHQLNRISEQHRRSRDFTLNALRYALREILAYFPVYRTYPGPAGVSERDQRFVNFAVAQAKRRNPALDSALFDFIRSILLLEHPDGISEAARREREMFAGRFQQVTSPVMAKGVEDTSFYIFDPLVSINDVGCHPDSPVVSIEQFHRDNIERQAKWPLAMLCTTSHDTKRTEDVRARIHTLAEVPHLWRKAVNKWSRFNRRLQREVDGMPAPSRNDEYLFYETLVGIWPTSPPDESERGQIVLRLQQYMEKATREAKERTSWINPNAAYDEAVREFVATALQPGRNNKFLADFQSFHDTVLDWGLQTALSQTVLKLMSPGVPDVYQGQETWNFSLVDPDNRRPVDYDCHRQLLAELDDAIAENAERQLAFVRELARAPRDPRLKLFVTRQLLCFRRAEDALFESGSYLPLEVQGAGANRICAFAWQAKASSDGAAGAIVVVPRFFARAPATDGSGAIVVESSRDIWQDTRVILPSSLAAPMRNLFTGATLPITGELAIADLLADFPAAVLKS